MNFRKLIERAMHEAREEFAEIVARKLAELMGDDEVPAARRRAPRAAKQGLARRLRAAAGSRRRRRAPADHMVELREKVLSALRGGDAMKKSHIMKNAKLAEAESGRVASVLRRLKEEGVVTMKGEKALATYTYKGG